MVLQVQLLVSAADADFMVLLNCFDLEKNKKSYGLSFECKMAEKLKMAAKA
jgi:hypothetical protein